MTKHIRIGIIGYGNLGRGVEIAVNRHKDMDLIAIFSRRGVKGVKSINTGVTVAHVNDIPDYQDQIDVMILCGGSASDLPEQTPYYTELFNTVDSFDNHSKIPNHFEEIDEIARANNTVSMISTGWDPGLFSLNRVLSESILPQGETYTFWGKGLSQGHSDAIRRVEGVKNGVQYTIPSEQAIESVRNGEHPELDTSDKHERVCYVVADVDADTEQIEQTIKHMPAYFEDYNTTVHFITEKELETEHDKMPHGGFVIRSGQTSSKTNQLYEFNLKLDSNPEFTASVLVASARAVHRLAQEGQYGAKTIVDVPISYFSTLTHDQILREYL